MLYPSNKFIRQINLHRHPANNLTLQFNSARIKFPRRLSPLMEHAKVRKWRDVTGGRRRSGPEFSSPISAAPLKSEIQTGGAANTAETAEIISRHRKHLLTNTRQRKAESDRRRLPHFHREGSFPAIKLCVCAFSVSSLVPPIMYSYVCRTVVRGRGSVGSSAYLYIESGEGFY